MPNTLLKQLMGKEDGVLRLFESPPTKRGGASSLEGAMRSLDYEPEESLVWRAHEGARLFTDKGKFWTTGKRRGFNRWALTFVIGLATALVALSITYATHQLIVFKFNLVNNLVASGSGVVLALPIFLALNLLFVWMANQTVQAEPAAAGSGVPEMKTYLNGVAIPRLVRAKTLLCKAVGVTLSVSGGLPCGKEGPMVQVGGGLAAGWAQGRTSTLGFDTSWTKVQDFRNDQEKRDFVACGAAAGVAAAFGAPIAGVLFTLEETATFWSTKLTWRTFFCCMVTVHTLYVVNSASSAFGHMEQVYMFNFGEFYEINEDQANFSVWELALFILIGSLGGIIGAATVHASTALTYRRMKQTPLEKQREVLGVALVMTLVSFFLPLWLGKCSLKPDPEASDAAYTSQEKALLEELVSFNCPADSYNELASLWMTAPETSIKQLFHFRGKSPTSTVPLSSSTLLLFFIPYQLVFTVMIGCAVPGGVFIPSMIAGAAMGRVVGHFFNFVSGSVIIADNGTYALVGAAAALSGLTRLTIAATVMLLEATGNMQYVLPLMLSVMTARFVGNVFNEAIQDMQITVKKLPFLEVELSRSALGPDGSQLTAGHIMSQLRDPPASLPPVASVSDVVAILQAQPFDCFPIADPSRNGALVGTVLRKTLCLLLKHKTTTFVANPPAAAPGAATCGGGDNVSADGNNQHNSHKNGTGNGVNQSEYAASSSSSDHIRQRRVSAQEDVNSKTPLPFEALHKDYPRFPSVQDVECQVNDAEARQHCLDLRPYLNAGPYTVHAATSAGRCFRLFRSLGLRHLCVVDFAHRPVGMITRQDLSDDALKARAAELFSLRNNGAHSDSSSSSSPVMVGGVNYHSDSSFGGGEDGGGDNSSSSAGVMGSWAMGGSGPDGEDEHAPLVGGRDNSNTGGDLGYGGV